MQATDTKSSVVWGAVVVAAGAGSRFGSAVPKQFTLLGGYPVVDYSIRVLMPLVEHVVVVTPPENEWHRWWTPPAGVGTVAGGARRQDSVMNGLLFLKALGVSHVLVHDGARPMVTAETVERVMEAAAEHAAVVPVVPVRDTVKKIDGDRVVDTLRREELSLSQTPQGFHLNRLIEILGSAGDVTDEAAACEAAGETVKTVQGSRFNIKLTDREDAVVLSRFVENPVRTLGTGLDFHPFDHDRPLFFCGCKLSETDGLRGHSDGDVVLHAVADAILSASRLGDIGSFFPPTEARWKNADSSHLLSVCVGKMHEAGWKIERLDVTVIGERPAIAPIRDLLMRRLSDIVGVSVKKIWIKGTTTNTIGELARGKGVGCSVLAELVKMTSAQHRTDSSAGETE